VENWIPASKECFEQRAAFERRHNYVQTSIEVSGMVSRFRGEDGYWGISCEVMG
jgi:hypothetical protein